MAKSRSATDTGIFKDVKHRKRLNYFGVEVVKILISKFRFKIENWRERIEEGLKSVYFKISKIIVTPKMQMYL